MTAQFVLQGQGLKTPGQGGKHATIPGVHGLPALGSLCALVGNSCSRRPTMLVQRHILCEVWGFIFSFSVLFLELRHQKYCEARVGQILDILGKQSFNTFS